MVDFKGMNDKQITRTIIKNQGWMKGDRRPFEDLWAVETMIFQPRRYDLLLKGVQRKGKQYGAQIYDGHPANAANKFSIGLLAHMMSRTMPWIQFVTGDVRLMKDDNVKKYVQGSAEQIMFGLNESDIYGQSLWFSKDASVIGTAINVPVEDKKAGKMHYETISPKDAYIKYDLFGNIITLHRPVKMSAIDALDKFEKEKLPKALIRDASGKGDPFKEYDFLFAMYRNPAMGAGGSVRSEDKKFKIFYLMMNGQNKEKLVFSGGTQFEPNIWTYGREPGTNYGVSIAADALTEGLQANKLGELMLELAHAEVRPATEAPKSMQKTGGINVNPDGRNWVPERYAGTNAIRQVFPSRKWPVPDAQDQRLHDTIDDKFFVPLWDALMTQRPPQKTATEVLQIQGNKAVLLSPVSESFEGSYLKSVVNNQWIFEETIRRKMPDVPDILLDPANRKIETVFIGPLNQLQRATMQTRGTINALEVIDFIRSIWPESIIKINEMDLMEEAAVSQGMKQTLIRSDEEVRAILDANAAKEQQQLQTEQLIEGAKAVPGLSKQIEENSALDLAGVGG